MSEILDTSPKASPNVMVGMASPLWGYFAGAAMMGAAFWWMTRPLKAENLEALLAAGQAASLPALEAAEAEAPFVPTAEAVVSEASGAVEEVAESAPQIAPAAVANDPAPEAARH